MKVKAMIITAVIAIISLMNTGCSTASHNNSAASQNTGNASVSENSAGSENNTDQSPVNIPTGDPDDDRPLFPDPSNALGVSGEYVLTNTEDNGVTYDFYKYELDANYEQIAHFIVVYTEALKNIGFEAKSVKNGTALWYEKYSYNGGTAAELGIFSGGTFEEITGGEQCPWRIVISVPENMVFHSGRGTPGIRNGNTICVGCNGTGHCVGCLGNGRANYGSGYEDCIICGGSGICNICDGEGSY